MIPIEYLNVNSKDVIFHEHTVVGSGSVLLPGAILGEGSAIGAMSLVKSSINPYEIWAGNPLRYIKDRSDKMLKYANELRNRGL